MASYCTEQSLDYSVHRYEGVASAEQRRLPIENFFYQATTPVIHNGAKRATVLSSADAGTLSIIEATTGSAICSLKWQPDAETGFCFFREIIPLIFKK
jgi:hypothetical protein